MNRAFCMIRDYPVYRRDAFMAGLKAAGYDARTGGPMEVRPGDVLVGWNRYGSTHDIATRFERAGGVYLCAENGFIGPRGVSPHEMNPREIYALARSGHNGSGTWNAGGPERWDALGVDLKPWRTDGEHVLVCPNRSFGRPGYIMPIDWAEDVKKRLERLTKRPVRIRPHPGNGAHKTPLADDLKGAWAIVIWSSSAGVQALIAGVPVICEAPAWIGMPADELGGIACVEMATGSDFNRLTALHALAWGQWHYEEIASGEPFRHLLRPARETEVAASA